jgi:hypothetical protein
VVGADAAAKSPSDGYAVYMGLHQRLLWSKAVPHAAKS